LVEIRNWSKGHYLPIGFSFGQAEAVVAVDPVFEAGALGW
jgi:hypothetical protein